MVTITFPHSTTHVSIEEIPQLIAEALYPRSGSTYLESIVKEYPGSLQPAEPLTPEDSAYIEKRCGPLPHGPLPSEQWRMYVRPLSETFPPMTWRLVPLWRNANADGKFMLRTNAEDQHRKHLRKAIQAGQVTGKDRDNIPRPFDQSQRLRIAVSEFAIYARQLDIDVVIEREEGRESNTGIKKTQHPNEPNPSADDDAWKTEARKIADRLALERHSRGIQEISQRDIAESVAIELAKNPQFHTDHRGPRSAGNVRNLALKGWKFIPP